MTEMRIVLLDDHPFFEQISNYFVSHLFKFPRQYTITDVLTIWVNFRFHCEFIWKKLFFSFLSFVIFVERIRSKCIVEINSTEHISIDQCYSFEKAQL